MSLRDKYMEIGILEENNITVEYNYTDWTRVVFGPISQISRWLDFSVTTIQSPDILGHLFLTKKSLRNHKIVKGIEIGTGLMSLGFSLAQPAWYAKLFGIIKSACYFSSIMPSEIFKDTKMKYNKITREIFIEEINPYDVYVNNVEHINWNNYEHIKIIIPTYRELIARIKEEVCYKIEPRRLTLMEKNNLMLFKPILIRDDMLRCREVIYSADMTEELREKWDNLYKELFEIIADVVKYLMDNIRKY